MSDCYGCEDARKGDSIIRAHTCSGSGTFRAAEAYASDAVDEITEAWPTFDVAIHFQARAADEAMVRDKMLPLVTAMLSDDLVEHSTYTITEKVAA